MNEKQSNKQIQQALPQGAAHIDIAEKNQSLSLPIKLKRNAFVSDQEPVVQIEGAVLKIKFSIYISDGSEIENQLFADSLVGMDELMKLSSRAFFRLLSLNPEKASKFSPTVYIDKVREGSKITDLVLELVSNSPDTLASVGSDLIKMVGEHSSGVIVVVIALILGSVAKYAIERFGPNRNGNTTINITNSLLVGTGNNLTIDKEAVEQILSTEIKKRAASAKAVAKVFGPAKRREGTKFKVGGSNGVEIPGEIVKAVPPLEAIQNKPETSAQDFDHVKLDFAAMDRDRKNRGWAAVLPQDLPGAGRRLPVTLADTVNPNELMYAKDAEVDLSVIKDARGRPKAVQLRKLHRKDSKGE